MSRKPCDAVVNIVTGPLSSGKTTAILWLLARRPADERWAVLVNEIGAVGIDGPAMKGKGVAVREIVGGCVCCANSVVFSAALAQLISREKPNRVLIEPSGLGECRRLKEKIRSMGLKLGPVMGLIPCDSHERLWKESSQYRSQLAASDVFVLNRIDQCNERNLSEVQTFAKNFFPPKLVAEANHGLFDAKLLDFDPSTQSALPEGLRQTTDEDHDDEEEPSSAVGVDVSEGLLRFETFRGNRALVGYRSSWIFDEEKVLDLGTFRTDPLIDRAKAIFRCRGGHSRLVHWRGKQEGDLPGEFQKEETGLDLVADESVVQLIFKAKPPFDIDDAYHTAVQDTSSRFQAHLHAAKTDLLRGGPDNNNSSISER